MSSERRLAHWLTTRTPEQLDLIFARVGLIRGAVARGDHARVLLHHHASTSLIGFCTLPQIQALSAVAWLAEQQHGSQQGEYWRADDPADRAVPRTQVLDLLAGTDPNLRADADATVSELADMALVLPPHGEQVIVPNAVHLQLAGGMGLGRPAEHLIAAYLNAPEVHKIATGLGFPKAVGRDAATLREAELLGVVAHGALTTVGHTILDLLRTGQAWTTPEPALTSALTGMLPPPQSTAHFQADLTAVVSGTPDARLAALLDATAKRESEGHAVVWRFSAATVRHALDAGHDATDLLAELAAVARAPLPQPLEYLIKDAGRTHGRMRVVRSGCCIRSDDEALLDELARTKGLHKLGLRKIAPTVLISSVREQETLAALRAAGYTPALEAETGTTVIEEAPQRRAPRRR